MKHLLLGEGEGQQPVRLLTLVGMGGCGKTRLALRVASDLVVEAAYRDGIWLVELAAQTEASLVPHVVAATLGARDQPGRTVVDVLIDTLGSKHLLLILDNCEHLGAACAELCEALLRACPTLQILITSRQALNIVGETTWVVPSLSVLDPDLFGRSRFGETAAPFEDPVADTVSEPELRRLMTNEAVQLFVDRAMLAVSNFRLTAQNALAVLRICHKLEGIPLAIELAAARIRVLSVWQIEQRLEDALRLLTMGSSRLTRHQTLRATMDWSYRLLSPREQATLHRLSVFANGFGLEAAEAVISDSASASVPSPSLVSQRDVLDLVSQLADKSLVGILEVEQEKARYRLLEPVRQYAADRLLEVHETDTVQARHAAYFIEMAETAEPELDGPDQRVWLAQLQTEYGNLRTALSWAAKQPAPEMELRLVGALASFWHGRGFYSEGRSAISRALSRAANAPTALRAKLLGGAGVLAAAQSEYSLAATYHQKALELYHEVDDKRGVATCLRHLGTQSGNRGDYTEAISLTQQSLACFQALGDTAGLAAAYNNLGVWAREQGAFKAAADAYIESLALYRRLRHTSRMALTLSNLGEVIHDLGEAERAIGYLNESITLYESLNDSWGQALNLHLLGRFASDREDLAVAETHYRESLALWLRLGNRRRIALSLEGLAGVAALQPDAERAARLWGAAEALREEIDCPLSPTDRPGYENQVAQARASLNSQVFEAAWTRGRAALLDQTIVYALEKTTTTPKVEQTITQAHLPLPPAVRFPFTDKPPDILPVAPETPPAPPSMSNPPVRTVAEPGTMPLLRIHALGSLQIEIEGDTEANPGLASSKPRELLLYVLRHPWVTKEEIGVDLWPHATPSQLRNRFHEAMHRLRRSLGSRDWLIVDNERYTFNRELNYWFDVEIFETQLKSIKPDSKSFDNGAIALNMDRIHKLQDALALYRGDFLSSMPNSEWIFTQREDLRQLHLEGLDTLGQCWILVNEYSQAAEAYRQIIMRDKYLEYAHRQLMLCYARLGERSKALSHYHRLLKMLQDEFSSTPDAETTTLFKRLARGEEV